MKRVLSVVLALVMCLTLVACGGNNDENNAAVQVKIEEADTLVQEIYNLYNDNGYLGENGDPDANAAMDGLLAEMEEIKVRNEEIVDGGGYSDEDTETVIAAIDSDIESYKATIENFVVPE